jgi:alpha-tubulin suppressor-like RCC1 family protein
MPTKTASHTGAPTSHLAPGNHHGRRLAYTLSLVSWLNACSNAPRVDTHAVCGDGVVDTGEACDRGAQNSDVIADACRTDCTLPACGDGVVDTGEACDRGAQNPNDVADACRADCTLPACGDGVVDTGEACDRGAQNSNDVADACRASCALPACGDGVVDTGEVCDRGAQNSDVMADACRTSCALPACGDGAADTGEICDDGNSDETDNCLTTCRRPKIVSLSVGFDHTCVVLERGNVRCWGRGDRGILGVAVPFGQDIGDDEPASALGNVDIGGRVVQVASGFSFTCALLDTGNVRCWGSGFGGKLGYGNTNNIGDDETPASAGDVDLGGIAVQITTGDDHACAVLTRGRVRCWGNGAGGALGYGNTNSIGDDETPASAGDVDVGGPVVQIAGGNGFTCARLESGAVRCWGREGPGRLGYGNTNSIGDDETPASAGDVNLGGTAVQVVAGATHACAVLDTGAVRCWGSAARGALGYGNTNNIGDDEVPASAGDVDVGGKVVELSAGTVNTCAVLEGGRVRCWGFGQFGQNGYASTQDIGNDETPASAGDVDVGGAVVHLDSGIQKTCALLDSGSVRCWGNAGFGALGYGRGANHHIGDDETPASAGDVPVF